MMKCGKILITILVLVLLLTFTIGAKAAEETAGVCGNTVCWSLDESGTLSITGSGPMKDYSASEPAPWHSYYNSIKTVKIAEGVTKIGSYAFYNLDPYYPFAITSVTIPKSVTSVGTMAFSECSNLTAVYYGDTLDRWTQLCVENHNADLQSVTLHCTDCTISTCGQSTFWELDSNGTLTISGKGPTADWSVSAPWHNQRNNIHKIVVKQGVTHVGRHAFKWTSAKEAVFADSVRSIGNYAFERSCLERITVGNSLTTLYEGAFDGCTELTSISLPNTVTSIGKYAFRKCSSLKTATLGTGLTSLGKEAFYECTGLREISIPSGVTTIDECTFCHCKSLTKVSLPTTLKTLGGGAFWGCTSLSDVKLPDSLTVIEGQLFKGCISLVSVYIPDGITKIEWQVFDSTSINQIYYGGTQSQWQSIPKEQGNDLLTKATIYYQADRNYTACSHKYSSWIRVDISTHKSTCSVCAAVKTANHTWDQGVVTKQSTCKQYGERTYTCTTCKATNTVNVTTDSNNHNYKSCTKVNDTTHKYTCADCGAEKSDQHLWNSGSITKRANCTETSVKTFTCVCCKATKTEMLPKTDTHTYDHPCTPVCIYCGKAEPVEHLYRTYWSVNHTSHWHQCYFCADKKDLGNHTCDPETTKGEIQTCTTCGYIMQAAAGHQHSYATAWTTDNNGHWYKCSGCEQKALYSPHAFENACDTDCAVCGYTRQTQHKFSEVFSSNAAHHWYACTGCGLRQDEAAHEPGPEATETTAQTCTICNRVVAPALGVEEITEPTESIEQTTEPTENASSEPTESSDMPTEAMLSTEPVPNTPTAVAPLKQTHADKKNFPIGIVIGVGMIALASIATIVIIKKKKS